MSSCKQKYPNQNCKGGAIFQSDNNFETENQALLPEINEEQMINTYLQKHMSLVNRHRNQQIIELKRMQQEMNKKLNSNNRRSKRQSMRYLREYDQSIELENKIDIKISDIKSGGKTKSFYPEINQCTRLIHKLKKTPFKQKPSGLYTGPQNQQSNQSNQVSKEYYNDYRVKHPTSISSVFSYDKVNNSNNASRIVLSHSLNPADLKNYRNKYYSQQSSKLQNPFIVKLRQNKIEFQSDELFRSPNKIPRTVNVKQHSLSESKPQKLKQLLDLYKLETEVSEDQISSSVRSRKKPIHYKQGKTPINFKDKQKQLDQLYKAKIKGSRFYKRIRQLNDRSYE